MALCVWNMRAAGEEMQTTCDVFIAGITANEAVTALAEFWRDGLAFLMSDELELTSISYLDEDYDQAFAGSITREMVPSSVAVVMRKQVAGGRNGRFYMPGITDANVDNAGRIDAAFRQSFITNMGNALTQLTAAGVALRVVQKDGSTPTVNSITCAPIVGMQSRRLARL